MKDKIIDLDSGASYVILDEIMYNNKKYALAAGYDKEKHDFIENNLFIVEIKLVNDDIIVNEVDDEELATKLGDLLAEKIGNSFAEKIQNSEE